MKLRWECYPGLGVQVQFNHEPLKKGEEAKVQIRGREGQQFKAETLNNEMFQAHQVMPEFAKGFLCEYVTCVH